MRYLFACLSVAGAVILALNGISGWGWLVFLAFVSGCGSCSEFKKEESKEEPNVKRGGKNPPPDTPKPNYKPKSI